MLVCHGIVEGVRRRSGDCGSAQCLNPACGTEAGQLGHLFNRDRMGATNIGRNLARLLDGRPLISAPQGLDAQLLDLDAALHNN
eukprot:scaffold8327_cov106-Isochrysis_galbana.AAC.1